MSSHHSFQVMEDFTEPVTNANLKTRLLNSLNRKSPFRNFKAEVDNDEHYRQQWFMFRDEESIRFLKEQIDELNEDD